MSRTSVHPCSTYSRVHRALVAQRVVTLRAALAPSERALWALLRGVQLGVWFPRELPLGRFVADFFAQSARLVVEVDRGYHARRRTADARRNRALARFGYRVLRLEAELVLERPLHALARVREALGRHSGRNGLETHLPRSRGGALRAEHDLGEVGERSETGGGISSMRSREVRGGYLSQRSIAPP